jgi:dienelactone hydrolase
MRSTRFIGVALLAVLSAARLALAADESPLAFDAKSTGGPNSGAMLELWRPAGPGPFPAMIVLHGCDGVSSHQRSWAARLVGWGYAAAIVDSFRPRGVNSTCQGGGSPKPQLRSQDAFNAAIYLRTLPDIAPDRVGIIGFSHGGTATLFATLAGEVPTARGGRPFAAAIAYYPGCSNPDTQKGPRATDLLILAARDDDWTPSAPCVNLVAAQAGKPHVATIKVYPVVHGFDLPGLPKLYADHMSGGNPEAAADSFAMSEAFLAARLKSK